MLEEHLGTFCELKPGSIYAIECDALLSAPQKEAIADHFDILFKDTGVKFILIPAPMRLARSDNEVLAELKAINEKIDGYLIEEEDEETPPDTFLDGTPRFQ